MQMTANLAVTVCDDALDSFRCPMCGCVSQPRAGDVGETGGGGGGGLMVSCHAVGWKLSKH